MPFSIAGISVFWYLYTLALACFSLMKGWDEWPLVFLGHPLGWLLQLTYLNPWVRYDDEGFTQRTLWRKTLSFRYNEITEIRRGAYQNSKYAPRGYEVVIRCGKAHLTVSPSQKHYRELLCLLAQKVPRERWKRLDLRKPDPSNHHIANGWRQVILTFLLPVIFAGLIVFEIVRHRLGYISKEDLTVVLWLFGSLGLLTLAWAILVLAVLRHPERHSQFLQKLAGRWAGYGGKIETSAAANTTAVLGGQGSLLCVGFVAPRRHDLGYCANGRPPRKNCLPRTDSSGLSWSAGISVVVPVLCAFGPGLRDPFDCGP